MSIIKYTITFFAGIYIGQEYGNTIPRVKDYTRELYNKFLQTEFYKQVSKDLDNKN